MTRPRGFRPAVEPLGAKRLPSNSALRLLGPLGALVEDAITPDSQSITGKLHGTAQGSSGNPDAGSTLDFAGEGRAGTLGQVRFAGSVRGVGFIRRGRAEGRLTLSNERGGSITMRLIGPPQRGGARLPNRFRFVVQEQSGASRLLRGTLGSVRITQGPEPGAVTLSLRSADPQG